MALSRSVLAPLLDAVRTVLATVLRQLGRDLIGVRLDSHPGTDLETVAGMFTIGDFATFTQVSIPALRL